MADHPYDMTSIPAMEQALLDLKRYAPDPRNVFDVLEHARRVRAIEDHIACLRRQEEVSRG